MRPSPCTAAHACGPRLAQVAINPQALPLHALGAVGKRTLSNTQLPTIVGGLVRAQRAKFLDRDVTRDDSKVSALLQKTLTLTHTPDPPQTCTLTLTLPDPPPLHHAP